MRATESPVIRPYLEQAVGDIDDLLARLQLNEEVERGWQEFCDAWEAGQRGDDLPDPEFIAMAWGHPWAQSARTAAAWLRQCGLDTEAIGIEVELQKLPDRFPPDSDSLREQNRIGQAAAEQVKTILTACLKEHRAKSEAAPPQTTSKTTAVDNGPAAGQDGEPPAAKAEGGEEKGEKKPQTAEPPSSHIIGDLRDTIRNRDWSDG